MRCSDRSSRTLSRGEDTQWSHRKHRNPRTVFRLARQAARPSRRRRGAGAGQRAWLSTRRAGRRRAGAAAPGHGSARIPGIHTLWQRITGALKSWLHTRHSPLIVHFIAWSADPVRSEFVSSNSHDRVQHGRDGAEARPSPKRVCNTALPNSCPASGLGHLARVWACPLARALAAAAAGPRLRGHRCFLDGQCEVRPEDRHDRNSTVGK